VKNVENERDSDGENSKRRRKQQERPPGGQRGGRPDCGQAHIYHVSARHAHTTLTFTYKTDPLSHSLSLSHSLTLSHTQYQLTYLKVI